MDENERDFRYGKLPLPVGKSDWEEVAGHCYCVDKTLLMRDLLVTRAGVALFTRPRRFGKTTAMQMLKCFFEKRGADEPDVRRLFESRAIAKCDHADEWMSHQGKYPVIYLTFKDHKALTWEEAYERLAIDIGNEFKRHLDCVESLSPGQEREDFIDICERKASPARLGESLGFLARALHVHSKVQPIVLIDEYDMPVTTASANGYYTEMVAFMRAFLPSALKDNNHVKMGVMTGVICPIKDTSLNGFIGGATYSIFDERYSTCFGFTAEEVRDLLVAYGHPEKFDEVREWYGGCLCGNVEIFNPESIVKYVRNGFQPRSYLERTLVDAVCSTMTDSAAKSLRKVADNGGAYVCYNRHPSYMGIRTRESDTFTWLVHSGLLTVRGENGNDYGRVIFPNREVESLWRAALEAWS